MLTRDLATHAHADHVRESVSIFDVLDAFGYGVRDRRTQQVRCPVHKDRHPSARVYADQNTLHCFTCGRSWNQIELVQAVRGGSETAAVGWLESQFDIESPLTTLTAVLRRRLARRGEDFNPAVAIAHTEHAIRSARSRLTLHRYSRAVVALDMVTAQVKAGILGPIGTKKALQQVLDYVHA